jgi:hypothetical protein
MKADLNIMPLKRVTTWYILVAVTKLQKATTSFVLSACLSICLHRKTWFPLDGFS